MDTEDGWMVHTSVKDGQVDDQYARTTSRMTSIEREVHVYHGVGQASQQATN